MVTRLDFFLSLASTLNKGWLSQSVCTLKRSRVVVLLVELGHLPFTGMSIRPELMLSVVYSR